MSEKPASTFKFYNYDPSGAAAGIFAALFALSALMHIYQMIRTRTWYMIPFIIGGAVSCIGYIGRIMSSNETPDWTLGPYIIQTVLLLVAPALFAASIYMELKRIIKLVGAEHHSPIGMRWLTKLFVIGDVLSFLGQASGGGILGMRKPELFRTGENIIIGGLFIQLIFFGLFVVTAVVVHIRLLKEPTPQSHNPRAVWRKHLYTLYFVSILIFVRSVFRTIEYIQGREGELLQKEIYLYIFDAVLMALVTIVLNVVHPSELDALRYGGMTSRAGGFKMEQLEPLDAKPIGDTEMLARRREYPYTQPMP